MGFTLKIEFMKLTQLIKHSQPSIFPHFHISIPP